MIVYAGKQFGNDFNNGDEALFQDASLPRDDFKFKIQHGLQTNKQDWRTANKNINMAQALVKCIVMNPSGTFTTPYFKTKYNNSDFSFVVGYTPKGGSPITSEQASLLAKDSNIQSGYGDACITVENGNIVIRKTGTYIIEAFAEFLYPTAYNPAISYQYIEYVELKTYVDNSWRDVLGTTDRACGTRSFRKASYVTNATAGDILNMEVGQNSGQTTLVNVGLNAYRLG